MIPLFREFLHNLLYSEEKVTLWLRSLWFGGMTAVSAATAQGVLPVAPKWAWVPAVASSLALLAKAGDKNKPPTP
jgi:hypothetical protein